MVLYYDDQHLSSSSSTTKSTRNGTEMPSQGSQTPDNKSTKSRLNINPSVFEFEAPLPRILIPVPNYPFTKSKTNNTVNDTMFLHGWEPWIDRNTSLYIRPSENTILSDLSCLDTTAVQVLILIQSAPKNYGRRNANRQTWMRLQSAYPQVRVLFIFGVSITNVSESERLVKEEATEFCDIVQFDFVDSYANVTLDTVSALKFAVSWKSLNKRTRQEDLKFIVIGDDDSYISIPSLWSRLFREDLRQDSKTLVGSAMAPEELIPVRRTNETEMPTWGTPFYMFAGSEYPKYLDGGAYILPSGTLDCLYFASLHLPVFHLNDIFITGFARQSCGFEVKEDERFEMGSSFPTNEALQKIPRDVINIHQVGDEGKSILFNATDKITLNKSSCSKNCSHF